MSDDWHLYYTDAKLGLSGGCHNRADLGVSLNASQQWVWVGGTGLYQLLRLVTWFALCCRCRLDHPTTERPLIPSAIFCMAVRPFSSSALEMNPGAAQQRVWQ